ncbi:Uncharacterized protein TCM_034112 [Theobroma cacao]|uniref:Uncharacterized protein n=1 Tax=Theobroma cacao TaxID=3641 RepID=A0A061FK25_THECC|nr:Uncharacterized protein TCM_034112 [Theobroma cacao]
MLMDTSWIIMRMSFLGSSAIAKAQNIHENGQDAEPISGFQPKILSNFGLAVPKRMNQTENLGIGCSF